MENETKKCEKCGGELIQGQLGATHALHFYPKGEISKLMPKHSPVVCWCCRNCGNIQDITAIEVRRIV